MFVLSLALILTAGNPAKPAPTPVVSSIGGAFFAVSVNNIDESTRWYADKFGMRVIMQQPKVDKAAVAILEGGALTVELVQLDGASPSWRSPERAHGIFKTGVVVDDLNGLIAQLKTKGVEIAYGPFPAQGNIKSNVIVRDNEGNLIQLFGK